MDEEKFECYSDTVETELPPAIEMGERFATWKGGFEHVPSDLIQ